MSLPLRTNYLYGKIKKTLPELYAFTICLWLRSSASPGIGTPFSYAVPGQANEIVLIEWGNNPIELLINDKVRASDPPPSLSWPCPRAPGSWGRLSPKSRLSIVQSGGRVLGGQHPTTSQFQQGTGGNCGSKGSKPL